VRRLRLLVSPPGISASGGRQAFPGGPCTTAIPPVLPLGQRPLSALLRHPCRFLARSFRYPIAMRADPRRKLGHPAFPSLGDIDRPPVCSLSIRVQAISSHATV
jgi:hypothetical protein